MILSHSTSLNLWLLLLGQGIKGLPGDYVAAAAQGTELPPGAAIARGTGPAAWRGLHRDPRRAAGMAWIPHIPLAGPLADDWHMENGPWSHPAAAAQLPLPPARRPAPDQDTAGDVSASSHFEVGWGGRGMAFPPGDANSSGDGCWQGHRTGATTSAPSTSTAVEASFSTLATQGSDTHLL